MGKCWYDDNDDYGYEGDGSEFGDDEPQEPEEGDYVTEDHRRVYVHGTGRTVTVVPEDKDFGAFMTNFLDAQEYWPNVWFVSDHGNFHLIDLDN